MSVKCNLQHNNDDKGPYPYPYPYVTSDIEKRASSEHGIQLKRKVSLKSVAVDGAAVRNGGVRRISALGVSVLRADVRVRRKVGSH
ncbi:hypothetical protein MRX96_031202 [Rhipicephalus microplus]